MIGIAIFFGLCMGFYALFVLDSAARFGRKKPVVARDYQPMVTVIIPARNEESGVEKCLCSVLAQDYPVEKLQVILVNDHSTDRTGELASIVAAEHENLEILDLDVGGINAYKKAAITAGVAQARGEIIMQTDADCEMGEEWVKSIVAHFKPEIALVSGPVILNYKNTFFEKFQTLEHSGLIVLGAGSLLAGRPNMANGANLAYRKAVFEELGGFQGIDAVASGDDELLLQKIHLSGKYSLEFAKDRRAIVGTDALPDWASFKAQRLRWVSKARYYPNKNVNLVQGISYLAFWGLLFFAAAGFFNAAYWVYLAAAFGIKLLADTFALYQAAHFFRRLRLLWYLLPLQPLYILYVLWIGIAGSLVKKYEWKGRRVN